QNLWQDEVGGAHTYVFAGALTKDPGQGVVFVRKEISVPTVMGARTVHFLDFSPPEDYLLPAGVGPVRIVAAQDDVLQLATVTGPVRRFQFVVSSRALPPLS